MVCRFFNLEVQHLSLFYNKAKTEEFSLSNCQTTELYHIVFAPNSVNNQRKFAHHFDNLRSK